MVLLKFWSSSDRDSVLAKCMDCRKLKACPGEQIMAPLPSARVAPTDPPFTHVVVEYFGPLFVKQWTQSGETLGMPVYMPYHEGSAH